MLLDGRCPDHDMDPPEEEVERVICDKCKKPILDNYYYAFQGKKICENCKFEFCWDHYRREV